MKLTDWNEDILIESVIHTGIGHVGQRRDDDRYLCCGYNYRHGAWMMWMTTNGDPVLFEEGSIDFLKALLHEDEELSEACRRVNQAVEILISKYQTGVFPDDFNLPNPKADLQFYVEEANNLANQYRVA